MSPSAFTTYSPRSPINSRIPSISTNTRNFGLPGIPYFATKSRVNDFEPSKRAKVFTGPTLGIPIVLSTSAVPATTGSSGPIKQKSGLNSAAKVRKASKSSKEFATKYEEAKARMPGLFAFPKTPNSQPDGLRFKVSAMTCSRAPLPTKRTRFIKEGFVFLSPAPPTALVRHRDFLQPHAKPLPSRRPSHTFHQN